MSDRSPRVLVLGACLAQPRGGVVRHNEELLPRLAERLRANGGSLAILEGRERIGFALPDAIERVPSDVPWRPTHVRAVHESRELKRALVEAVENGRPFDVVHTAHHPTPRGLDVPMTLTIHDLRSLDLDRAPFVRRLVGGKVLARSVAHAARIGCVSEWMRGRIAEEFPGSEAKIDVIGNGADHLELVPREPAGDPFVVHVGQIEPRKNLDLLVRAMAHGARTERLVLAGHAHGATLDHLLALASELGIRNRVEHEDAPDDDRIARLYATATCAVFPSRLEGFGVGPVEAIRASCPVAVSRIPAHLENVGEGVATFDVDDVDGCVAAIGDARAPEGAAARTWDECADAWHAMLRRAMT